MKKNNILTKIIILLFILILGLFEYQIIKLNILPNKYLILEGTIATTLLVISILVYLSKSKTLKIVTSIFQILLLIIFGLGISYLFKMNYFIDKIGNIKLQTLEYYVLVLKPSEYNEIDDLKGKNIGYISNNINKLNVDDLNKIKYEKLDLLVNDLLNKKLESILIDSNQKDILEENDSKFNEKVKILYTLKISDEVKDITKDVKVYKEPFNILISGIDTAGAISKTSRSDVNIVMTINPNTNEILLTTIPRDYYVQLHNTTGNRDKLTHAGIYGINMSVQTIEDLLNIDINYYVRVNFTSVEKIVDAIGGVNVYSDSTFSQFGYSYHEGYNELNGKQALIFSRIRKVFAEGDRKRGVHQQAVITAIIKKVSTSKTLLSNYGPLLNSLSGNFQTNMNTDTMKSFIKYQLNDMNAWKVESISLDGTGSKNYTYSMPGMLLYVMEPDQNTVNNAHTLISGIMNNQKLEQLKK